MDDSTQITQDTTVTAQYNANTYTVKINPNGASGSTKTYTVTYGQKWSVPSCPFSRTGYTFSGYSGGYSAGQSITITGNVSINCNWSIRTYTVYIYPNGASGSTRSYSVNYGGTFTVPSCPFTHTTFTGYKTGASSGTSYSVGSKITNITSNISLYCQWQLSVSNISLSKYKVTTNGFAYSITSRPGSGGGPSGDLKANGNLDAVVKSNVSLTANGVKIGTITCTASDRAYNMNASGTISGSNYIHVSGSFSKSNPSSSTGGSGSGKYTSISVPVTAGGSSRTISVIL